MSGGLKRELKQKRAFSSIYQEVLLSILRTADHITVPLIEVLREASLSTSQYNVLRILRGAGGDGLACGEIGERMVQRDPDLTRLLDRLEKGGLVSRARGLSDRRVVRACITSEGLRLLKSLDQPVDESLRRALAHVPVSDLRGLVDLLEEVRNSPP